MCSSKANTLFLIKVIYPVLPFFLEIKYMLSSTQLLWVQRHVKSVWRSWEERHLPNTCQKPYQDGRLIIKSNMQMKYNVFFIHFIVDLLVLCVRYQIQTDSSFMINSFAVTMRVWGVKDRHQNWYIDGEEQGLATAVMDSSVKDTSYISASNYHSSYVDFMKAELLRPLTLLTSMSVVDMNWTRFL